MKTTFYLLLTLFACTNISFGEDGYRLWLRYETVKDKALLTAYQQKIRGICTEGNSPVLESAKEELTTGLSSLLSKKINTGTILQNNTILIGTAANSALIASLHLAELLQTGQEGYTILTKNIQGKNCIVIAANSDAGVLYGAFRFLQLLQTNKPLDRLSIVTSPKINIRLLNHWDNLNRTVERGYAGFSIWKWHLLPGYIDPRYRDYARANASIGINGAVINNVNANVQILTKDYLKKAAAIADVLRPWGMKVYLAAKFSAPIEIGKLKTADPLDEEVKEWWKKKVDEIYTYIPDFGGFVVKANSEGQPGPQNYKRSHAEGANAIADALAPHNGIVMWRAFVYSNETPVDRTKQSYNEFKPLDGSFRSNVILQVKNGPLDFQPREPFHPLFGALPKTSVMMEFQITQEYLGQGTHLVYEAPLMKEVLDADTYAKGKGTTVAKIIDGSAEQHSLTGIAGVSNIGDDRNWCGHPFAQANWYAYGKLTWDHSMSADEIADEWIRMTFSNDAVFVKPVKQMMLGSRETMVRYMTPLGLHHIMGDGHHYGPSPWSDKLGRADWNPVYYHRADSIGIGFERTEKGSNALEQYMPEVRKIYADAATCPDEYLLWFHHIPWNYQMKSGKTLWNELCTQYYKGVEEVRAMQETWSKLKNKTDPEQFEHVTMLLAVQEKEAVWWRNACVQYFATFSKQPIPAGFEQPEYPLEYYKNIRVQFAPGNGGGN